MKRKTFIKQHKWVGLLLAFFLLMFCWSGIILNHRLIFSSINVNRRFLPPSYKYHQWNQGLIRGSLSVTNPDSSKTVFLYGNNGIWKKDAHSECIESANTGLPEGVDNRQIKAMTQTADGRIFALEQWALYCLNKKGAWIKVPMRNAHFHFLTDMTFENGKLYVMSRSHIYEAEKPYDTFKEITLKPGNDYDGKVSLFRTIWKIHSGELFGTAGRLIVDFIALALIVVSITGVVYWFMPRILRRRKEKGLSNKTTAKWSAMSLKWHDLLGRKLILLLLLLGVTGWCLRPPMLIAIFGKRTPAVPFSEMDSGNAWHDQLKMLRYDNVMKKWMVSTENGFYSFRDFTDTPQLMETEPPASVMGVTVWERTGKGEWLIGSLLGAYIWNPSRNSVLDYYTRKPPKKIIGPPVGDHAIAGFFKDEHGGMNLTDYFTGTSKLRMPDSLKTLPMSLWQLALETHSGRIYTFLGSASILYVFIIGLAFLWCIWTGWKIRLRFKKKKKA